MARDLLTLHLDAAQIIQARDGQFPLVTRLQAAAASRDVQVAVRTDSLADRQAAAAGPGWTLSHLHEPLGPRGMTLRRAYFFPFWRIERTGTRWLFDVVRRRFNPDAVPAEAARKFRDRLRKRMCGDLRATNGGFIHVPLQGRILEHRSFQAMAPIDMIRTLLSCDPRPLRASLHPTETYSSQELAALRALARGNPRLRIVPADPAHLAACDLVATQNSSVAMTGYLLDKPAILFAAIDFHHIAASVPRDGLAAALAGLAGPPPDFAAYLWWFFQTTCIDAMSTNAEDQILAQMRKSGWPH